MSGLWRFAPVIVLLALLGLFAGYSLHRNPTVVPMARVGKPLPDLTLSDLADGAPRRLRSAARGPVLVNFYASWCGPCAEETPALMALRAEGVRIVGIAYKDSPAAAAGFLSRLGNPYQSVLVDRDGAAGVEFGLTGVPETYAVDAQGVIRGKQAEPLTAADTESLVRAAGG